MLFKIKFKVYFIGGRKMKKGSPFGTHRVISPKGVLPQPADVIDNTMEIYDNEVLIDVHTLNVDSCLLYTSPSPRD